MERVYKREGILFKILPCLLIAMYAVMCLYGSTVCATDVEDNEISISTKFYGDFTIPEPPKDLYYTFFTYTCQNSRYGFFYVFSYEPIEFSIDYETETVTASASSSVYTAGFSVGDKDIYIYNVRNLKYDDIKSKLNSGSYENTSLFNLNNSSTNSIASDITTSNNCNLKVSYDENNNVVFQGASQEALATIIRPQVEGIQLQTILQEIIQILPLTIAVVVSFLGLRKALSWLLTRLRQS